MLQGWDEWHRNPEREARRQAELEKLYQDTLKALIGGRKCIVPHYFSQGICGRRVAGEDPITGYPVCVRHTRATLRSRVLTLLSDLPLTELSRTEEFLRSLGGREVQDREAVTAKAFREWERRRG